MKVCLPAIEGHVPSEMVCTLSAFLDFCYYARRNSLNESVLGSLEHALEHFHHHRRIFQETGVREHGSKGFSLPRQRSMMHYWHLIQEFGAPNGLCSSITESKHIKAVKKPWWRSNHFEALGQMLVTNQCLDKLAAAQVDFQSRRMLDGSVLSAAMRGVELWYGEHDDTGEDSDNIDDDEIQAADDGPRVLNHVHLAKTPGMLQPTICLILSSHCVFYSAKHSY